MLCPSDGSAGICVLQEHSLEGDWVQGGKQSSLLLQNSPHRRSKTMAESHCSDGSRVIPNHWTLTSARSSVKRCRKQSFISMRYVNRCPCGQGMSITLALPHLWVCSIRNSIRSKQFADLLRKIKYHQTELPRQGIRSTCNIWSSWSFLGTWIFLAFGQN